MFTLQNRAKLARLKFLHQLFHKNLNLDTSKYLTTNEARPTRHNQTLTFKEYNYRTDCLKYSFFPLAVREWNSIQSSITGSSSIERFLTLIENHLHETN